MGNGSCCSCSCRPRLALGLALVPHAYDKSGLAAPKSRPGPRKTALTHVPLGSGRPAFNSIQPSFSHPASRMRAADCSFLRRNGRHQVVRAARFRDHMAPQRVPTGAASSIVCPAPSFRATTRPPSHCSCNSAHLLAQTSASRTIAPACPAGWQNRGITPDTRAPAIVPPRTSP